MRDIIADGKEPEKKVQKSLIEYLEYWGDSAKTKTALRDEQSELCYGELLLKAKAIATAIARTGSGLPIVVKVGRNLDTVLTFFGIAMSGNYYIPIDACITDDKFESIINTSGAKYLIDTSNNECSEVQSDFAIAQGVTKLNLSALINTDIDEELLGAVKDNFNEDNPLYLIYTSGSTGVPKGVLKTHRNVLTFVDNFIQTLGMDKDEVVANQAPFSFDASAKDIYLTLVTGGTLCITPKQLFSFPTKLIEYLNINKVTFLCWVPSALTVIARMRALSFIKPTYLKRVFFVGEVFQPKYLNMFLRDLPNVEFYNLYGSTEIAGVCLYYKTEYPLPEDKAIPLGCPLIGNAVFLCDSKGGVATSEGEICIISNQIAIGYINDAEKNKMVFTTDEKGRRVLKTGDYGAYDAEKNLRFVSRKDFQIKHMGYRIELQEIELEVNALPYIASACCVYDAVKEKICVFTVLSEHLENAVKQVLNDLKQRLQPYMMPSKVTVLESMPLNTNGKIDRVKLNSLNNA